MEQLVHIGNSDISVKEYNGKRVVTFKDIDLVHGRPDGTARHRFAENRERFIENEDYFVLTPQVLENTGMDEKRPTGIDYVNPRGTAFLTEQGYLMLVKSFTDDLAWDVQRQLVNGYFKVKSAVNDLSPQLQLFQQMFEAVATQERAVNEAKQLAQKAVDTTEAIKEAVQPVSDNWRDSINAKFNRIQMNADKPFNLLRTEMYSLLELRAGCDLNRRLRNKKERMQEAGCTKTDINSLNKMDIIEENKGFREIFSKIVMEYEVKYCA